MKTHYIYLNTYSNGYLYIGSHTWSGEGIDPTYHGSSSVATHYGWKPSTIEILEVVSEDRKFVAEREWIEHYASLYGIADCALQFKSNSFTSRFKSHGKILNLHCNSMENAYVIGIEKCKEPEVRKRAANNSYKTQLAQGKITKFREAARESIDKSINTRKENGSMEKWQRSLRSPEALLKRNYKKSSLKVAETKKGMEVHGRFKGKEVHTKDKVFKSLKEACFHYNKALNLNMVVCSLSWGLRKYDGRFNYKGIEFWYED